MIISKTKPAKNNKPARTNNPRAI
ncbi:hypothetical protein MUS_2030 [Bacillus velezensis YAU B9601-Y2]|uniref:Uncharacterized protein n=1 Tax=Bacillus amyloliquefaciens (strain Y2) TaxID=1155777 RepID=I2C5S1_BACAY|nr:hypothetical protein MUS_2030 [Bacillus velezensis YAU B9601-Y2]